jgi:hypothetical protein
MNTFPRTLGRRHTALGFGVLLILAGAVLVSPLGGAIAGSLNPSQPAAPAASAGKVAPSSGLSSAQGARALAIARAHPDIASLIAGRKVSTLVVPWTALTSDRLLGAGIDITWTEPVAVSGNWPALYYDETEQLSPPYKPTVAAIEATGVTGVHVSIDLESGKVLRLEPMPGATILTYRANPTDRAGLPPQPTNPR